MKGKKIVYHKTQYINHYDVIIDMAKYFQVNVDEILNGERQVTQQKSRFLKNNLTSVKCW